MTCKDCMHYELCFDYTHLKHSKSLPDNREDVCEHFKNKANFVELPCKVGDIVYVVSRYYAGDWEVYKCNIDNLTIYGKNTFISCDANTAIFGKINFGLNVSEIGKTVFLTKEEAEQALKGGADNE